ncbi:type II toxin-antitoxin system Phd/YefM family antitoxin [Adlercreutzia sp. R25]|uniref:Antitoxin n=1 Tax=Adlercreutzia shanghongiae TaxID=3111773 RepID=A0ABU6IWN8_9ACTN|nr:MULTISPECIES: type II toxin-antitoxin system Phd/YefM family antitoxin [unclassified Adlercreutzia]MEC4273662.1 type II toxin-antitoxin system Phd/YefM family antitoxin [Adlercreutzia sp. R25]MEC4294095.1 type II toxin-antitoxin system Phd/YefM family antitoxin [Adlercreutzia sp. R22]
MTTTMGMAEAKNNFSKVMAQVQTTGRPVTILKNNKPCAAIVPMDMLVEKDPVSAAVDFMDEYADVFEKLS